MDEGYKKTEKTMYRKMEPISRLPESDKSLIRYVLTDIDDTLTENGRINVTAFTSMQRLCDSGIDVIPITGRPAGWCDHIARMWPVAAVVGENGAFYFRYDSVNRKMIRRYWRSESQREKDQKMLDALRHEILAKVPGCRISSDQNYRDADLAVDFCEDVAPLPADDIDRIVACFKKAGAQAKVSSIHVNGWYGDYDKLAMTRVLFKEIFQMSMEDIREQVIFIGDSPNDAPMFEYFPHSVGVANVKQMAERMSVLPSWVTRQSFGNGFAEMVETLMENRGG